MRRIALYITSTIAGLILLFSYRTSWGPAASSTVTTTSQNNTGVGIVGGGAPAPNTGGASRDPASSVGPSATATPATSAKLNNARVNGSIAQTIWGPVQVQVVIAGGRITDIQAIQYPNGNGRDYEINSYALPQLHDQVIAAQSANIDGVSGATVTSQGYIASLQAALDYAHFG
jgi:uncharacterized protein with FMN-binding domain